MKKTLNDAEKALVVQKHQLDSVQSKNNELTKGIKNLEALKAENLEALDNLDALLDSFLAGEPDFDFDQSQLGYSDTLIEQIEPLDSISFDKDGSWEQYLEEVSSYAQRNEISLEGNLISRLLTPAQRAAIEKRIDDELTYKSAKCDKYDYMLAAASGIIAGIIDVTLVGAPGTGKLGKAVDNAFDGAVERFAKLNGWKGGREGSDPTKSAIGYLEQKFKVNYDHRHGGDVNHLFKMSTRNHHLKSVAHSPDLLGLISAIVGQFTNTAHFIDKGKLIVINTDNFELQGSNTVAKIYSGFVNWLGHLFSDMAGSSGALGRGSGIPMPFYNLLQFIEVGEFGKHRQSFRTVAVKAFEEGYDLRHGAALAIPVIVAELLTRFMWALKQRFIHKAPWLECIPKGSIPELRRMLLISHGALCLIDGADAALKSAGNAVGFLLNANMVAWARFGTLAFKEAVALYRTGHLDIDAANDYLDREYQRLLNN